MKIVKIEVYVDNEDGRDPKVYTIENKSKNKKRRTIDPRSPNYDPKLVDEWIAYKAGTGPEPKDW